MSNKLLFYLCSDGDYYVGKIHGQSVSFCKRILNHLNIPEGIRPVLLTFYVGKTFSFKKVIETKWKEGLHRLDGHYETTLVKVKKITTSYIFNDEDISKYGISSTLDKVFDSLGANINFDCYYYE